MSRKSVREIGMGLAFIGPNILGFLAFTLFPLIFCLVMAFTNWDLQQHNMFKDESVRFIGLDNFRRLLSEADFYKYFGNTLFFMMGIPFGIGGSLLAAVLLSQDLKGKIAKSGMYCVSGVLMIVGVSSLMLVGMEATAMTVLLTGLVSMILVGGLLGRQTTYRTLFYFPHFTAGVATFILWKKLYSSNTGPLNTALRPALDKLSDAVNQTPATLIHSAEVLALALMAGLVIYGVLRMYRLWNDGELGALSLPLGIVFVLLPSMFAPAWSNLTSLGWLLTGITVVSVALLVAGVLKRKRSYSCSADEGVGFAVIVCGMIMVLQFGLLGLGRVLGHLPEMSANGLNPPEWLTHYPWAKPSLMFMGLWASVGSNNMLLYLAGLSNVPPSLYEAADIDGARPMQRFWNVTWPQLAPVTFFITVMAVIGGLQGGFEMARTMTEGGPAGATTTLSYYVYTEGFMTGRLGYASATAWALFGLIFIVTIVNWRFGNRYVND